MEGQEPQLDSAAVGCAYLPYYLTAVITLVLLLLPLVVSAMGYYGVWAMATWLFILAVYFTAKLM